MNNAVFEEVHAASRILGFEISAEELAQISQEENMGESELQAIAAVFQYMKNKKTDAIISMLLRTSRLPLKAPKTFENFDFNNLHGKNIETLKNLTTLSALYARKNVAFIGPPGVGKTHLAMAFGRACCDKGFKTYFIKATELNQKFLDARKYGREGSTITSLVKPTCIIIDEIGRCVFDKENTRMFFDLVDRRYNKDCPNTMIFTSNISPDKWGEFFSEDSTLLCTLDRIFDDATVFMMKGDSYRGRGQETIAIQAGRIIKTT